MFQHLRTGEPTARVVHSVAIDGGGKVRFGGAVSGVCAEP